ncbi:copper chaperone PCu(A)C [Yoonia sediminilitoris]|uniref:Copper(I)-binding protein n=1 Tax=Yoonia sediminilitoris TaxID=1286148 RepID=A0A2T6KH98_9RHOB|nr:copper chaperone PCu(A)C [Yoonia sediminilitoris]PUB14886.1 hypothetical protein C8N45_105109 [Yoonia sediminilitoris]RCW95603.1 hypothetical protein DFP92_105109 [Yoonia sediminilitoris]
MKKLLLTAALSLTAATPLFAHDMVAGDLHIIHPSIPDPLPTAKSAAGYMVISNDGDTPERLLEVRTPFAKVSTIHETVIDDAGVARMQPVVDLVIAPNDMLVLEPGGMHVMFMGLTSTADEGDMIPATLIFQNAGEVVVEFMVDPSGGMDHSAMGHD